MQVKLGWLVPLQHKIFIFTFFWLKVVSAFFCPACDIDVVLSSVAREITFKWGESETSASCSVNHILTQDPLTATESCNGPIFSNLSNSVTIINMSTTQKVNSSVFFNNLQHMIFPCIKLMDLGQSLESVFWVQINLQFL